MKILKVITLSVLAILAFAKGSEVFASECSSSLICKAYSRANKVYIGKLTKVEKDEAQKIFTVNAYFTIETSFKGDVSTIEKVSFRMGGCIREFVVGARYLVYDDAPAVNWGGNRTDVVSRIPADLEYVRSRSKTNPTYEISGRISNLPEEELKKARIEVTLDNQKLEPKVDRFGNFSLTVTDSGIYRIKIVLIGKVAATVFDEPERISPRNQITTSADKTTIEYLVEFKPNDCDYREIRISSPEQEAVEIVGIDLRKPGT